MRQSLKETLIVIISGVCLGSFLQAIWAEKMLDEFWGYRLLILCAVGVALYYYIWRLYAFVLSRIFAADVHITLRGNAHTYLPTALLCLYFPFKTPGAKVLVIGAALTGIVLLKLLYIRRNFRGSPAAIGTILDARTLLNLLALVLVGALGLRVFNVLNLESEGNRFHVQYLKRAEIGDEVRPALGGEFPNHLEKRIVVPEKATLEFGVGVSEDLRRQLRSPLGFNLYLEEQPGWVKKVLLPASSAYKKNLLFSTILDPARREEDGTWRDASVDLAAYAGKTIDLVFEVEVPQPGQDTRPPATGPTAQEIVQGDFRGLLMLRGALWSEPRVYSQSSQDPQINLLFLSADALRADHLSCYGYNRTTSPSIDQLAQSGVRFANAFSQTNSTNPSFSSIFTSTHVQTHGVRNVAGFLLNQSFVTLAETLKAQGFRTAAVTSVNHLHPRHSGLGQGFDNYFTTESDRGAGEVNELALRWLEQNQGHRFFLWVHYFDPHIPYEAPPPFDRLFVRDNAVESGMKTTNSREANEEGSVGPSDSMGPEDAAERVALYDGEIRLMDEQIGLLMKKLRDLGLRDTTLVIFTADHGESLTEHGIYFDHSGLYDPSIHVPLIMACPGKPQVTDASAAAEWTRPGGLPEGKVVEALVQSIDIMPTILDFLGIRSEQQMEGQSLLPLTYDKTAELHPEIYLEHANEVGIALRTRKWKLIYPLSPYLNLSTVPELFDLENDPREVMNLAAAEPEILEELQEKLLKWRASARGVAAERIELDEEDKEKLRALGYLK